MPAAGNHHIARGVVLLAALVSAAVAVAQDGKAKGDAAGRFSQIDRDADGQIRLDEFLAGGAEAQKQARTHHFRVFDENGDGSLSAGEFASVVEPFPLEDRGALPDPFTDLVERHLAVMLENWGHWNTDGQDGLTLTEFVRGFIETERIPASAVPVHHIDGDRDGMISHDEGRRLLEILVGVRRSDDVLLRRPNGLVQNYMLFRFIDTNHSDSVERAELAARTFAADKADETMAAADADKNGRLTAEEWWNVPVMGRNDSLGDFLSLDANRDGRLDRDELVTRTTEWKQRLASYMLPAFDGDGDGVLSLAEYRFTPYANQLLRWHDEIQDPNDDGKLTVGEFTWEDGSFPLLRRAYFERLDRNRNGTITPDEYFFRTKTPDAFFVMNADGTGWRKLFEVENQQALGSPAVSPDGNWIAFDGWQAVAGQGHAAVFITPIDGSAPVPIGAGQMPTWSPDGKYLACSRRARGVCILTLAGQEHKHISSAWGGQWSPDGRKVSYYEGASIKVFYLETEQTREVLGGPGNPYSHVYWNMTWSPDSSQICFKGVRQDGSEEIATISAEGAELGFRVQHRGQKIQPDCAWHPRGDRVVFSMHHPERNRWQLYEFNPDNDDPPKLVAGQDETRNNTDVCWTPDGTQLIVISGDF